MGRPTKEFQTFDTAVRKLLTVSKEEFQRRHEHHKATAHKRGSKRGPKPKATAPSVSDRDGDGEPG